MTLLGPNGRWTKSSKREPDDLISRAEAEQLARTAAEEQTIRICEFYLTQVPQMVVNMVGQIMTAHGMELQPPPKPTDVISGEADYCDVCGAGTSGPHPCQPDGDRETDAIVVEGPETVQ